MVPNGASALLTFFYFVGVLFFKYTVQQNAHSKILLIKLPSKMKVSSKVFHRKYFTTDFLHFKCGFTLFVFN